MSKTINKLLTVFAVCFLSCLALFFVAFKPETAFADGDGVDVTTIMMDEGASVRLKVAGSNSDKNGIRFVLFVNAEWYDAFDTAPEIGMYISRISDIDANNTYTTAAEIPANAMHYIAEQFTDDSERTLQETKSFNVVIYDIPDSGFNTSLIANGYYKLDGEETLHFATNPQTRSVAQVASVALREDEETGDNLDILLNYVDKVVTESNFKFDKSQVNTDMYKTNVALGLTIPENLTAIWSSSDETIATVDESGNVTRTGKFGDTAISATLGSTTIETTLSVGRPAPLLVNSANVGNIFLQTDSQLHQATLETTETDEFGGIYTGNSAKIRAYTSPYAYSVKNEYTLSELNAIKNDGYTHVSFWVACDELTQGLISFYTAAETRDVNGNLGENTVASKLGMNNGNAYKFIPTNNPRTYGREYNTENWYKIQITIDTYIDLLTDVDQAKSACPIWATWSYNTGNATCCFYFGDITFDKYPVVTNTDMIATKQNQNKYEWAADGITGDYDGYAVKYSGGVNQAFYFTNPYSAEELTELAETYNTVNLKVAFNFTGGTLYLFDTGYEGKAAPGTTAYRAENNNIGKWLTWSISLSDYVELVSTYSYEKFRLWSDAWSNGISNNITYYFGELTFS